MPASWSSLSAIMSVLSGALPAAEERKVQRNLAEDYLADAVLWYIEGGNEGELEGGMALSAHVSNSDGVDLSFIFTTFTKEINIGKTANPINICFKMQSLDGLVRFAMTGFRGGNIHFIIRFSKYYRSMTWS